MPRTWHQAVADLVYAWFGSAWKIEVKGNGENDNAGPVWYDVQRVNRMLAALQNIEEVEPEAEPIEIAGPPGWRKLQQ